MPNPFRKYRSKHAYVQVLVTREVAERTKTLAAKLRESGYAASRAEVIEAMCELLDEQEITGKVIEMIRKRRKVS